MTHQPVLLDTVVDALAIKPDGIYIDATYGRGGHARGILAALGDAGRLLVLDRDAAAVAAARAELGADRRVAIEHSSFAGLHTLVQRHGWLGRVNGLLLDLGVSSAQLDEAGRGFSFRHEGPLDMRMDQSTGMTAAQWLAKASRQDIARVLADYGEERHARRIARAIVEARQHAPIETTRQLASIITKASPSRERGKDPATRSFQAIRIHINSELEALQTCLDHSLDILAPGGRLAVISFHSLEDRLVKRFIRNQARGDSLPPDLPVPDVQHQPTLRPVGKPVYPGPQETRRNPRSRSAVLRIAEKMP